MGWRTRIATLVAVAGIGAASCASVLAPVAPRPTPEGVKFELMRSGARSVVVAGSFNHWSATSNPLVRNGRDTWSAIVPLPAGEHLFMFIVDGEWMSPPAAEDYADDGFGARNGIVIVK